MAIDFNKHIWEGWTVQMFIDELEMMFTIIMEHKSWKSPFETVEQVKEWVKDNQPNYKKRIPEVEQYFIEEFKKYKS